MAACKSIISISTTWSRRPRRTSWTSGNLGLKTERHSRRGLRLVDGTVIHFPVVMGILNVTPDSFSDGDRYLDANAATARAIEMARLGAGIIDIGGESTRPGASAISLDEELDRVIPVIAALRGKLPCPISVDTRKAPV